MRTEIAGLAAIAGTLLALGSIWMAYGTQPRPARPGGDPHIQQWLSDREALQIELNDTLVEARQLTAPSIQATTTCDNLARISQRLLRSGSTHPRLDTATNAGVPQFAEAAQACLAGDFSVMRHGIDAGTTLRAQWQDTLDEILDGDDHAH